MFEEIWCSYICYTNLFNASNLIYCSRTYCWIKEANYLLISSNQCKLLFSFYYYLLFNWPNHYFNLPLQVFQLVNSSWSFGTMLCYYSNFFCLRGSVCFIALLSSHYVPQFSLYFLSIPVWSRQDLQSLLVSSKEVKQIFLELLI